MSEKTYLIDPYMLPVMLTRIGHARTRTRTRNKPIKTRTRTRLARTWTSTRT